MVKDWLHIHDFDPSHGTGLTISKIGGSPSCLLTEAERYGHPLYVGHVGAMERTQR
jgi:hypothetical protein